MSYRSFDVSDGTLSENVNVTASMSREGHPKAFSALAIRRQVLAKEDGEDEQNQELGHSGEVDEVWDWERD